MGYTHFWYRPKTLDKSKFKKFASSCRQIYLFTTQQGVRVGGGLGVIGTAQFSDSEIRFNGAGEEKYETFHIPRELKLLDYEKSDMGYYLRFCKTGLFLSTVKPYDLMVKLCLIALLDIFGNDAVVQSDGEIDELSWQKALQFYASIFKLDQRDMEKLKATVQASFTRNMEKYIPGLDNPNIFVVKI